MFRTIIIDDDPGATANLKALLEAHPKINIIETINEPDGVVDSILANDPDLLFLDIQLPGKTGFEIAKEKHEAGHSPAREIS